MAKKKTSWDIPGSQPQSSIWNPTPSAYDISEPSSSKKSTADQGRRGGGDGGRGATPQPQSTIQTPTPSAETLTGTTQQREQQIKEYQQTQTTTAPKSTVRLDRPSGAEVSAYKPETWSYAQPDTQPTSFFGRTKQAFLQYPSAVKSAAQGVFTEGDIYSAVDILPIVYFPSRVIKVKKKGEEEISGIPWRGTEIQEPFIPSEFRTMTRYEKEISLQPPTKDLTMPVEAKSKQLAEQQEKQLAQEFNPKAQEIYYKWQGKVDTGEITQEKAQKGYEFELSALNVQMGRQFQKGYEEKFQPWFEKKKAFTGKIQELREPSFDVSLPGKIIGTAAVLSTVPGQAFMAGKGAVRIEKTILSKPSMKEGIKEFGIGALELGAGLVGFSASMTRISKGIDVARLESLESQKVKIGGAELYKGEKGSLFAIRGARRVGSARQDIFMKMPVFPQADETVSITGGKAISKLTYFSHVTGKQVTTVSEPYFFKGTVSISTKPPALGMEGIKRTMGGWQGAYGRGYIISGKQVTSFPITGISKQVGDYYSIAGGKATKLRIAPTGIKVYAPIQEYGFIKRYITPEQKGINFMTGSAKSSKQFFEKLYAPASVSTAPTFMEKTAGATVKITTKTVGRPIYPSSSLIGTGTRAFSIQEIYQQPLPITKSFTPQLLTPERQTLSPITTLGESTILKEQSLQRPRTRLQTLQGVTPITLPTQAIAPMQSQQLRTKQASKLKQIQTQPLITPTPFVMPTPISSTYTPFIPFIPPFLPSLGFNEGYRGRVKSSRTFFYQPSLAAIGLDISASAIPSGVFTGIVTRPKIKKKKKK